MKIWIDISSPPHVNFFKNFIEKSKDEIIVTARNFGNVKESLKRLGIEHELIGSHGKTKKERLIKSAERIKKLTGFIKEERPDIGLSKHSVECPRVCFGLGIPNISVIDHETATIQNRLIIPLSDIVVTPSFVSKDYLEKFGAREIMQFHGVCEYVNYIDLNPSNDISNELELSDDPIIISRSEPFLSSHVHHKSNLFFILKDLLELSKDIQIVFIPRNESDKEKFSKLEVIIPEKEIDILSLYKQSSLMIGAGCCMNREACLGGCPTVSVYPDELPTVDKFLINKGLMKHTLDKNQAIEWCLEHIDNGKIDRIKLEEIVEKFENPHETIINAIGKIIST